MNSSATLATRQAWDASVKSALVFFGLYVPHKIWKMRIHISAGKAGSGFEGIVAGGEDSLLT